MRGCVRRVLVKENPSNLARSFLSEKCISYNNDGVAFTPATVYIDNIIADSEIMIGSERRKSKISILGETVFWVHTITAYFITCRIRFFYTPARPLKYWCLDVRLNERFCRTAIFCVICAENDHGHRNEDCCRVRNSAAIFRFAHSST